MIKRIATILAGACLAASTFAAPAQAAPIACFGSPQIPSTFACIVRVQPSLAQVVQGPTVNVPSLCAGVCSPPFSMILPDIQLTADEIVVVYYDGVCYYLGLGTYGTAPASSIDPPDCP